MLFDPRKTNELFNIFLVSFCITELMDPCIEIVYSIFQMIQFFEIFI